MAKFCNQCGRPLQEGEVCTCQAPKQDKVNSAPQGQPAQYGQAPQGQPAQYGQAPQGQPAQYGQAPQGQPQYGQAPQGQPQYGQAPQGQPQYGQAPQGQPQYGQAPQGQPQYGGQPYGQPQYGGPQYGAPQAPKQPGAAGVYMKGLWGTIIGSYKKPAGTLANLAVSAKAPVVFGILGIQTLFFSLIFLFAGFKVNSLAGGYIKIINTPLTFFMAILAGAGILAIWGAVVMVFAKSMAKKPMTYMQGLGVASAKALAQMPFTLLTALFMLILPLTSSFTYVMIMLSYTVGSLLTYFFVPAGMDAFLAEDKNKRIWQLFLTFLVNMVATYVIAWIFIKIIGSNILSLIAGGLY